MDTAVYSWLTDRVTTDARVRRLMLGINWTLAEVDGCTGLAFSPVDVARTLPWPGTLAGRSAQELAPWLLSSNPSEAAVALAVINASLNSSATALQKAAVLRGDADPHLRIFEYFSPLVSGGKVAVIGHYPGLDRLWANIDYRCIERRPRLGDLPESAAADVLPESDWVFVTASSIANHSLHELLSWSRQARVVLMGPSLPWLEDWRDFGVDYLAGVRVRDPDMLWQTVAEAGGTRIFVAGVDYCLLEL